MTITRLQLAIVFLLLVPSTVARADTPTFEPVGPPIDFTFDAPDGRYQDVDIPITCPVNALRASVRMSRYGTPTTAFEPGTNFYLFDGDSSDPNSYAKLGFHATGFHPPFLVTMSAGDKKRITQKLTFARKTGADNGFSLEIRWNSNGAVQEDVDGEMHSINMPGKAAIIHLMGFSVAGNVVVQLGYIRNDDKNACHLTS